MTSSERIELAEEFPALSGKAGIGVMGTSEAALVNRPLYWIYRDLRVNRDFSETITVDSTTPINKDTVAVASITEISAGKPFKGAAIMEIHDVTPGDNKIIVRGTTNWGATLSVRISVIFLTG